METPAQYECMGPIGPLLVPRFETETRHQSAKIDVSAADLTNRGLEQPVLGLDRTESSTHRGSRFKDFDIMPRSHQPGTADQPGEPTANHHDRSHLGAPRLEGTHRRNEIGAIGLHGLEHAEQRSGHEGFV